MKLINMKDRGQKTGDLHVLRESNMPTLLTEKRIGMTLIANTQLLLVNNRGEKSKSPS